MKTFAKVIREGQNFYIQHTPSRGVYGVVMREGDKKRVVSSFLISTYYSFLLFFRHHKKTETSCHKLCFKSLISREIRVYFIDSN